MKLFSGSNRYRNIVRSMLVLAMVIALGVRTTVAIPAAHADCDPTITSCAAPASGGQDGSSGSDQGGQGGNGGQDTQGQEGNGGYNEMDPGSPPSVSTVSMYCEAICWGLAGAATAAACLPAAVPSAGTSCVAGAGLMGAADVFCSHLCP